MNWYQKQQLLKIAQQQDFNWKQQFLTKLQDILKNHKSKAAMMSFLMMTAFPMIDNLQIDFSDKEQLKNDALQIEKSIEDSTYQYDPVAAEEYRQLEQGDNMLPAENVQNNDMSEKHELMPNVDLDVLKEQIKNHEGFRSHSYIDTEGVPTIGIGANLKMPIVQQTLKSWGKDVGQIFDEAKYRYKNNVKRPDNVTISEEQAKQLLDHQFETAVQDVADLVPNFQTLPPDAQMTLVDMSFNLGKTRLKKFEKMIKALSQRNFDEAANQMVDSKWYNQVGDRSKYLVDVMRGVQE